MSYGLNYLCLCYFSFQRETSLFLECGWQTHTLFYGEVSLCLGLKPFLFHQLSWWFFFTQVLNKKRRIAQNDAANWWTRRGSNPRPLGCEPNALPAELRAHVVDLITIPQQGKIVKLVLKKVLYKSEICVIITFALWGRSSAGRAFGSHPRGREFESLRLHHKSTVILMKITVDFSYLKVCIMVL